MPDPLHPDPAIAAELAEEAREAARADLSAGYPPRRWRCDCGAEHSRGHFQAIGVHRCLACGYVGTGGTLLEPDDRGEFVWGPAETHHHTIDQLRALSEMVNALPPVPERIIGRLDVPRGRTFRMWNTSGRLVVYANRLDLERLPRLSRPLEVVGISTLARPGAFGIPVHYETAPLPEPLAELKRQFEQTHVDRWGLRPWWHRLARRLTRRQEDQ